jgi:hemoglobin
LGVAAVAGLLAVGAGCKTTDSSKTDVSSDMSKSDMSKSDMSKSSSTMAEKSLYERLGGEPALTAVVDDFVARTASNPKVNFTRKGTPQEWPATPENVAKLKRRLVTFIAEATGGPKKYDGKDMKSAHAGMQITSAEFDALAGDLAASLDKFKVPAKEKNELMAIAASTKGAMVEK